MQRASRHLHMAFQNAKVMRFASSRQVRGYEELLELVGSLKLEIPGAIIRRVGMNYNSPPKHNAKKVFAKRRCTRTTFSDYLHQVYVCEDARSNPLHWHNQTTKMKVHAVSTLKLALFLKYICKMYTKNKLNSSDAASYLKAAIESALCGI